MLAAAVVVAAAGALVVPAPRRASLRRAARPEECPEAVWERIVDAEQKSREKKFGSLAASLSTFGLDKEMIEENRLRIWEELKAKQASGAKPARREAAEAAPAAGAPGPFAGLRKAWDDVYKEADAMGYAQAVALNAQLENKGVLPKAAAADADASTPPKARAKSKKRKSRGPKPAAKRGDGFG